jgi:hypothetical protein
MVAKVKEFAMDGRYQVDWIMRRAVVIVADNVVFIGSRWLAVAQICVSEIGDVYFRSMDPLELRQLRLVASK